MLILSVYAAYNVFIDYSILIYLCPSRKTNTARCALEFSFIGLICSEIAWLAKIAIIFIEKHSSLAFFYLECNDNYFKFVLMLNIYSKNKMRKSCLGLYLIIQHTSTIIGCWGCPSFRCLFSIISIVRTHCTFSYLSNFVVVCSDWTEFTRFLFSVKVCSRRTWYCEN